MTPDAEPFSGVSHWWAPESPPAVLGGSAATPAARPPAAARAPLGAPAWMNLGDLPKTWTHHVSNEKVPQVQIKVDLQIADRVFQSTRRNATTYYADLRQSFLECYKEDEYFQISGLETATWLLRGRSRFKHEVHLQKLGSASEAF